MFDSLNRAAHKSHSSRYRTTSSLCSIITHIFTDTIPQVLRAQRHLESYGEHGQENNGLHGHGKRTCTRRWSFVLWHLKTTTDFAGVIRLRKNRAGVWFIHDLKRLESQRLNHTDGDSSTNCMKTQRIPFRKSLSAVCSAAVAPFCYS